MKEKTDGKDIVIINQDAGYLMIDIVSAMDGKVPDIALIAGRLVVRNKPLPERVRVRKIVRYNRSNKTRRLISWATAFMQIVFIIKTRYRRSYLLIVSNPPLNSFLPLLCRNRFSLLIFDVYPDALTQLGLLKEQSFFVRLWGKANRKVFARADNIFTLTESMSEVLGNYCSKKERQVVPVWSDNEFFKPVPKDANTFVADHSLERKFVVLYSGNLGATHNVEILPAVASLVKNRQVLFLIIGDGDRRKWLSDEVAALKLSNVLLLPLQPPEKIPYSFASANIAIVSQGTMVSGLSLPSKTFNFMSAGLPLLCITGENSELRKLVGKYGNGRCFRPEQIKEIAAFIDEMVVNDERLMHYKSGSLRASLDFSPRNAEVIADAVIKSSLDR